MDPSDLKDSDNLRRIEALRSRHQRLRDERIRVAAESERAERDLLAAREQAMRIADTDDLDELRRKIRENYAANTAAVDEFERLIAGVESDLAAADSAGS